MWFLFDLDDDERIAQYAAASQLIHDLRIEEKTTRRAALLYLQELLQPVLDANPKMTIGDAFAETQRLADLTIRGLESSEDPS
jgi:hypothetical protein